MSKINENQPVLSPRFTERGGNIWVFGDMFAPKIPHLEN